MTPEQQTRAAAEQTEGDFYEDGRPKMHRHFAQFDVHRDDQCRVGIGGTARHRVYVFDEDYLDEHEAFIAQRERAAGAVEAYEHIEEEIVKRMRERSGA